MADVYGFVYFLSNPSMPGIYKIGFTSKHPRERMAQLSASTSCPTPFKMVAFFDHPSAQYAEVEIHEYFNDRRVNLSREFFQLSLVEIRDACRCWCDPYEGVFLSCELDLEIEDLIGKPVVLRVVP